MVRRRYRKAKKAPIRRAKVIRKIARSVVRGMTEKKYFDLNIDHYSPVAGALFQLTSNIVKGTDQNQRVGDRITLRSLYFKQTVLMNSTVGETKFRAIIVRAKGSATTPSVADILLNHTTGLRVNSAIDTDKYEILYDKVVPLTTDNKYRNLDIKLRFNKNLTYNNTVGSAARELFFLTISDAGVYTPAVQGNLRMSYIDV